MHFWGGGNLISNKCRHADISPHKTSFIHIRKRTLPACGTAQAQASRTLASCYMQLAPCQDLVHFIINPLTALTVGLANLERLYSSKQKTSHKLIPQQNALARCQHTTHFNSVPCPPPFSPPPPPEVEEETEKYNLPCVWLRSTGEQTKQDPWLTSSPRLHLATSSFSGSNPPDPSLTPTSNLKSLRRWEAAVTLI